MLQVAPRAPPRASWDRVVYGLVQPALGARMLVTHADLLRAAFVPAAMLAGVCAAVALLDDSDTPLRTFYTTFAVLAPLPSVLLAPQYARLAVLARHKFGYSRAEPCIESRFRMLLRAIKQTILIAVAVAPAAALLRLIPVAGDWLVRLLAAGWALHWIVVDAFDSARFLRPGQTVADLEKHAAKLPSPWYVRGLRRAAERAPLGKRLLHWFARVCDRLSRPWREEIALIEDHPPIMLGFALTTAAVVALPIVNLLFRPIVIIGAAHVLGRLEASEPESPALPPQPVSPPG